jgi:hypothetical protein
MEASMRAVRQLGKAFLKPIHHISYEVAMRIVRATGMAVGTIDAN